MAPTDRVVADRSGSDAVAGWVVIEGVTTAPGVRRTTIIGPGFSMNWPNGILNSLYS